MKIMMTITSDEFSVQGEGMAPPYFQQNIYDINEQTYRRTESPLPSPRFGSLRHRRRVERDYSEDTSEGSDGRTSSDEYDSTAAPSKKHEDQNNNQNNQKNRKNSHFAFSSVKKKITSTFQRRHSVAMHPPSPSLTKKQQTIPMRRSSTADHSPQLLRQASLDEHGVVQKRKTSLRRHVTMAAVRLHEQNQVSGSNPLLNRILQKSQFQLESSSSTPDIKSHMSRDHSMKSFKVHILGSKSVGKTALSVRFLTGRYIHEYNSTTEESYKRVMNYEDDQVDVDIHINDIEKMEKDIELDQQSGIMILYSVIDMDSFKYAKFILNYLVENSITECYPVMLVGTKRDLSRMRQVARKEAFKLATQYSCTQVEVSSASNRRVVDSFHAMFRQIEIRNILKEEDEGVDPPTIVNPPLLARAGKFRYGTA